MSILRAFFLAVAALAFWVLFIVSTPILHQAIFAFIPPDGPLASRERNIIDREVTSLVGVKSWFGQAKSDQSVLTSGEYAHIEDVTLIIWKVGIYILPGALIGLILARFRLAETSVITGSLGLLATIGLITGLGFEGAFIVLHKFIFPQGNWVFPSDQYVITQVYPAGFFVAIWIIILLASLGTLVLLRCLGCHYRSQ
ncbi:DUF1461 domain-containing protein [Candidatus Berkelbacteria bacterium]|nr:DUF1461 domain-containing protein [Candidatus Berkelbacteria bacterium]